MYKFPQHTEHDTTVIASFMEAHPFVTLVASSNDTPAATQVPVLLHERDGQLYITCHVMRHTDHFEAIAHNPSVLLLFQGPHCYISPGWYTQKMGGTWNYQTIHVRGNCRVMTDAETMELLVQLTARFEAPQAQPLLATALPANYMPGLVGAIAGLEIIVTDIYPIFKLSQNRDDESYKNIVRELQATTDTDAHKVAAEMVARRAHLFVV